MVEPRRSTSRTVATLYLAVILVLLVWLSVGPSSRSRGSRHGPTGADPETFRDRKRELSLPVPSRFSRGDEERGGYEPREDKGNSHENVVEKRALLEEARAHVEGVRDAKDNMGSKLPQSDGPKIFHSVDLSAPDGFLWQPVFITPPECKGGGDSGEEIECEGNLTFCLVNIDEYQRAPWTYPMAPLVHKASKCSETQNQRIYKLSTMREHLHEHPDEFLHPTGFIFHETRTGSTLVANMLAHVPSNLVMSEDSLAEERSLRGCKGCTREQKVFLIREILVLLGSAKSGHKHSFFKFKDATWIGLLTEAFPDVPWIFLFREPVEVMVSNLKGAFGKRQRVYKNFDFEAANASDPAIEMPEGENNPLLSPCLIEVSHKGDAQTLEFDEEIICATRLKKLCDAAVEGVAAEEAAAYWAGDKKRSMGVVVEYTNLPDVVTDFLYPHHFGMGSELLEEHMPYLSVAASKYSKAMGKPPSNFTVGMDARYKHLMAEDAYREAAESTGLRHLYHTLQRMQTWKSKE